MLDCCRDTRGPRAAAGRLGCRGSSDSRAAVEAILYRGTLPFGSLAASARGRICQDHGDWHGSHFFFWVADELSSDSHMVPGCLTVRVRCEETQQSFDT